MKIDILTLFPDMFEGPFEHSIIKRAVDKELIEINIHSLRSWAKDKHKTVDSKPYGGGAGMIIKVDIVDKAITNLKTKNSKPNTHVVLLSPQGKRYNQEMAAKLAKRDHIILIAGHYEGFDERIRENLVDEEISIGDYVLTGGEIPAMVVVDSVVRLIPRVLGSGESLEGETHSKQNYKKHPVYTRPEEFKGWRVPEVLLSGNHSEIEKWKKENTIK